MHASFRHIIQLLYISAYHWMRSQLDFPYSTIQVWSQLSHWLPDVVWIRHMSKRKRTYRSLMMEEELSGFQVDPAVSDGTPELGRRSGKEFDQQVERKDLFSDWWWYCPQSAWTLCNPGECSPLGSSVYGIFQARVLEWVAICYSRGSCWSRDLIWVSCISLPLRHLGSPCWRYSVMAWDMEIFRYGLGVSWGCLICGLRVPDPSVSLL